MNPILDTLVFLVAIRFIGINRIFQFWPCGTLSNNRDNFESLIVKSWQTFFCEDVKSKDIFYQWWARGKCPVPRIAVPGHVQRENQVGRVPRKITPVPLVTPISVPVPGPRDSSSSGHERIEVQILFPSPGPKCRDRRPGTGLPKQIPGRLPFTGFDRFQSLLLYKS